MREWSGLSEVSEGQTVSRRTSDSTQLWCPVTVRDRIVCDDVKAAVGLDSDPNLVRTALYHFAVFVLGAEAVDTDSFRLRQKAGKRQRGRAPMPLFKARKSA